MYTYNYPHPAVTADCLVGELHRVGIFDAVDRDPRERIITVAYYTILDKPAEVSGLDDAAQAKWFSLTELPNLAFDHKEILQEAERVLGDG